MLLARLEAALDRPASDAERALMLWFCPPAAELRRLPAARGLIATPWSDVERAPGAEVGFLSLGDGGDVAVSVDSRVHVDPAAFPDFREGVAAAFAKLVAVGVQPMALHVVVHGGLPENSAGREGLRSSLHALSAFLRGEGVATVGAELCLDPEYGETLVVDSVAIGWREPAIAAQAQRVPQAGDRLVAVAGSSLHRVRRDLLGAGIAFVALPTSSDVPLRAVIASIGDLGLDLRPAAHDRAHPEAALERIRPDPTRSILLIVPESEVERVAQTAAVHGAMLASLGAISASPHITVGTDAAQQTCLPAVAVREPLDIPGEHTEPDDSGPGDDLRLDDLPEPEDYEEALRRMLRAPNLASRKAFYERFDTWSGGATVLHPDAGSGVAALRTPGTGRVVAVATSGNPRFTALDPYVGFCIAVCEGVRRLATRGARHRALVGGTSFGASHDPQMRRRAEQGLAGLRDAALAFALPCLALTTSPAGPDEHPATPVTPGLALLGTLDQAPVTPWFKEDGDVIVLLGRSREEVAGSEYAAYYHASVAGNPPWVDFGAERALCRVLTQAAADRLLQSARNVGPGGLALSVVHACCSTPARVPVRGARLIIDEGMRPDAWLFAESQARAVVSVSRKNAAALHELAQDAEVPFLQIGEVAGRVLEFGSLIGLTLDELLDIWNGALAERLGGI